MMNAKPIDIPIGTCSKLDADEPSFVVNATMYSGIIGSLLYLIASRSKIVFSVGMLLDFKLVQNSLT